VAREAPVLLPGRKAEERQARVDLLLVRLREIEGLLRGLVGKLRANFIACGRQLAGRAAVAQVLELRLLPAGVLLGFVTTWGEPAVRILAEQVEDASNGSIRRSLVLHAVCIGVAVWVGLGMLRIVYGIPILYLLLPGYLLVIAIMWLSDRDFVGVAVDAGGVATGPLANTFLLALALAASESMGGQDPLVLGLGLISLIALAPVISLMALGLLIRWKGRQKEE
jgi:hypothetical protein